MEQIQIIEYTSTVNTTYWYFDNNVVNKCDEVKRQLEMIEVSSKFWKCIRMYTWVQLITFTVLKYEQMYLSKQYIHIRGQVLKTKDTVAKL